MLHGVLSMKHIVDMSLLRKFESGLQTLHEVKITHTTGWRLQQQLLVLKYRLQLLKLSLENNC